MTTWMRLALIATLTLLPLRLPAAEGSHESWLLDTLRHSNPVREQLAMLGGPGQPASIQIHRGSTVAGADGQPVAARIDGNVLVLSQALVERLQAMEHDATPKAGRWTLLYILAYLASHQLAAGPGPQREAEAMLQATNLVLATAWEEAGRPEAGDARLQLRQQVLDAVPYARLLQPGDTGSALRLDADGFVVDRSSVRQLAWTLARHGGHPAL